MATAADPRGAFAAPSASPSFAPPADPGTFVGPLASIGGEDLKERERSSGAFSLPRLPVVAWVALAALGLVLAFRLLKRGK